MPFAPNPSLFRLLLVCAAALSVAGGTVLGEGESDAEQSPVEAFSPDKYPDDDKGRKANRLIREKSPYLLQHAYNPVDWYPWGDEAFAKAKKENKPILLSIGYATCHWCHVMERESFEDEETAKLINEKFVAIKLDREERPDVDRIYMGYLQALTGSGGWPLNVLMTYEKVPFFAGTYFPPEPRGGRKSFKQVLEEVDAVWKERSEEISRDGKKGMESLEKFLRTYGKEEEIEEIPKATVSKAFLRMAQTFDGRNGGFGDRPKFPQPVRLLHLLGQHSATLGKAVVAPRGTPERIEMVTRTLDAMMDGGIYDHLGGGFHRYSVDEFWHVPHFEKMLYDQAQLLSAYAAAYTLTGNKKYRQVIDETVGYVKRQLSHPGGGFYSAEDADSAKEEGDEHKHEGAFFIWTKKEVKDVLPADEAEIFCRYYGVVEDGNVRLGSDPHGEFAEENILFVGMALEELAEEMGVEAELLEEKLGSARKKLFEVRSKRPRPIRDDKVITAWNGLMISGLAHAYQALGNSSYLEMANESADFILENLVDSETGEVGRIYKDGPSDIPGFAEDYAFLVAALLDLYECDFNIERLKAARLIQGAMDAQLWDDEEGGYFDSGEIEDLVIRLKSFEDSAEPSANSIAALNLVRLAAILKDDKYHERAGEILSAFAAQISSYPASSCALLTAFHGWRDGMAQVVIATGDDSPAEVLKLVRERYSPYKVVVLADGEEGQKYLAESNELMGTFRPTEGSTTLFFCKDFTCQAPTASLEEIDKQLGVLSPRPPEK